MPLAREITPADRFFSTLDSLEEVIVNADSRMAPEFFVYKPEVTNGPEILDEDDQPFDPPQYEQVTNMVPDIEATQAKFDLLGDKAAAMTVLHAIACAFANAIHRISSGHLDPAVLQFAGAGIAVRDAGLTDAINNNPPVDITVDYVTGTATISPKS